MLELEKLKTFIENLLEFKGVCKECEKDHPLWQHLYHLYLAAAIYTQMPEEDKKIANAMQKRLSGNFARINVKIKQKKRKRKDEKEKISPTPPLIKEKEEKEKDEETPPKILVESDFSSKKEFLEYRQELFKQECLARKDLYGEDTCLRFFYTWGEANMSKFKMRWEMQKTWNIDLRLKKFSRISYEKKDEAAQLGLENAKRMREKEAVNLQQQSAVAEIREDANAKLEREIAERKKGAVSYEEYLKMKEQKQK